MDEQTGAQSHYVGLVGSKKEHTTGVHIYRHGWPTRAFSLGKKENKKKKTKKKHKTKK